MSLQRDVCLLCNLKKGLVDVVFRFCSFSIIRHGTRTKILKGYLPVLLTLSVQGQTDWDLPVCGRPPEHVPHVSARQANSRSPRQVIFGLVALYISVLTILSKQQFVLFSEAPLVLVSRQVIIP